MREEPECYGDIFPDPGEIVPGRRAEGKAFWAVVGSSNYGRPERRVGVIDEGWRACRECPQYRACIDLSMARLQLWTALG